MSGTRRPPQARDRMLGLHLRQHRVERGLTLEAAAEQACMSSATMSRTESGKRHVTAEDVAALLALYRVAPERRTQLVSAARGGYRPIWWTERAPGWPPDILGVCTANAHAVTEFALNAIPHVLQTRRYGLGHLRACAAADLDAAWAAREELRGARELLEQTFFLHESALQTPYGGPGAFGEQLHHLRVATERGIGVRLVRAGVPLGSLNHGWAMMEYPDSPPMVYVELQEGGLFLHEPAIGGYRADLARLREVACTIQETRAHFARLAAHI
ncbi:Scr1 family TA system antitoxin-like transcriptional regulator [Actinokineospora guangxiensis]|uniref:Scr1 family TA system antitoxin-like transcriptional regulator n=1 Tax=Actinokineospora guangxiensis TaxID=1490288 RepID=A0ABW0EQF5_9PSEU